MDNKAEKIVLATGGTGGTGTANCQRLAVEGMQDIAAIVIMAI